MGKDKYSREARLQHKALKQAAKEQSGQLHPSWQAKRQQQAQASIGGAQPAAKKVKFDD